MQPRTQVILIILAIAAIAGGAWFLRRIAGPRVVARAVAPDGTEFCVVQKCTWDGDLFNTACYYRKPGGPWGWFYYDHEDWYWEHGRADVDEKAKRISVIRDGRVTATFDWESETYELVRAGSSTRTVIGAQDWKPVGWSIGQE
jgi:hypothetical protein